MTKAVRELYPFPAAIRYQRLAVLIDGDNVSSDVADRLFEEIAKFGEISVCRVYGDFSVEGSINWGPDIISEHAISSQHLSELTTGKNGADIAMTVDAMDLLRDEVCDGFCLVSSDCDFTRLAERIRKQGLKVFGFSSRNPPKSLQNVCHKFVSFENLAPRIASKLDCNNSTEKSLKSPTKFVPLFREAVSPMKTEDGWIHFGSVGKEIRRIDPNFKPEVFGCGSLIDLMKKTNQLKMVQRENGGWYVRKELMSPSEQQTA
ncbi:MAG: NYN domain-containing protein [Rhizobiaceae bacterium]